MIDDLPLADPVLHATFLRSQATEARRGLAEVVADLRTLRVALAKTRAETQAVYAKSRELTARLRKT